MQKIYVGADASNCDGSIAGLSTFLHMLTSKPEKSDKHEPGSFMEMITIGFTPDTNNDYSF